SQHDFPVKSGNDIVGILTRSALLQGWAQEGGEAYVAEFMKRDFLIVPPEMALEEAILKVQGTSNDPILVMEKGASGEPTLIGLLTQENLLEFLKLRQLQNMRSQRPDRR
ncbi:MAG: CBS domain-containing protein, partial [Armatimonadetes bacterium]|nr:CBS domain-containing protein [Armatimonadota bacterium]